MNNTNTSTYSQTNSTWSSTLDPTHSKIKKQGNSYRTSRASNTGLPSPPRSRQREQRLQVRRLEVAILGGVSAPPVFHRPFLPRRGRADHGPRGPALARVRRHAAVRHCLHRTAVVVGHTLLPFSGRAYGLRLLWGSLESNQIYGGFGGGWSLCYTRRQLDDKLRRLWASLWIFACVDDDVDGWIGFGGKTIGGWRERGAFFEWAEMGLLAYFLLWSESQAHIWGQGPWA